MIRRLGLFAAALVAGLTLALLGAQAVDTGQKRALLVNASKPTWAWDFAAHAAIPAGTTFTRASSASCGSSVGILVTVGTNVPCFDYDPATLAPLGYRSLAQSTNGLLRSGDLGNAAWTASGVTVTSNSVVAPDGTTSMAKLVESNANVAHKVTQAVTLATATTAGFSWFVEAKERSKFYVAVSASANNCAVAIFDTAGGGTTATQTATGSGSGTIFSSTMRSYGGGIYRLSMQASVTGANPTVALGLASLATGNTIGSTCDVTYAGDGASAGYGWGAQFDSPGVGVTAYIPTAGSTVTRSTDILTLPLTSLPGWNASKGGVLVAAYRLHTRRSTGVQVPVAVADSGAFANTVILYENYSGSARGLTSSASNLLFVVGASAAPIYTRRKTAFGWSTTRQQIAHDGSFDNSSGGQTLPASLVNLRLGTDDGTSPLNGTIEGFAYYAGARSDAFVQQVSK